jgi:hypothetical protein
VDICIEHRNSSPAVTGRLELSIRGLQLRLCAALEVSASDDNGLAVPGERRHGAEGEVAAIAVGVDAGATHAAFRLMRHLGTLRQYTQ